jgi:DNA-binding NarL/FixJ family response regulator
LEKCASVDIVVVVSFPSQPEYIRLVESLRQKNEKLPVLAIPPTDYLCPHFVQRLAEVGAAGCIARGSSDEEIVGAIRNVAAGRLHYDRQASAFLVAFHRGRSRSPAFRDLGLTPRQKEVALRLAAGDTVECIGHSLCLSPDTIRNHRKSVFKKAGVHSRTEFMQWARQSGLLGEEEGPGL